MAKQISAIDRANGSWDDYFDTLKKGGQGYVVDYIKNTQDLSKVTGDDLVKANQNARQSAIAHNAALKQQTLGAKAAKFAMSALATVGNMIVFTLISEGISKLMNIETEALEKAQASYEAAVEEVNKLNEREDVALSTAKELSELFSDEDWGSESAKRVSDIYNEMADRLEDVGGAEDDRIQQLRDEAKQIRENIGLSKEERLAKAEEERRNALSDSGWDKQSNITKHEDAVNSSKDVFWGTIEDEFSDFWNNAPTAAGVNVYALSGDILDADGNLKVATEPEKQVYEKMLRYIKVGRDFTSGQEYLALGSYESAIAFMEAFEQIQEIPNVSGGALYESLREVYDMLSQEYSDVNNSEKELITQRAKKDAYDYFNKNGFNFDSKDDEDAFVKFLKNKKYDQKVVDSLLKDLENGGFYSEEYWKDLEDGAKNVNKMTVSLSDLSTASEALSSLSKAFKELSNDSYITTKIR
ncbi:MAG: hypothetical protein E7613_03730 [Ruminococcaceae bacterium]|nr:hypothetical protein [Oscillospiraceae bacterium]